MNEMDEKLKGLYRSPEYRRGDKATYQVVQELEEKKGLEYASLKKQERNLLVNLGKILVQKKTRTQQTTGIPTNCPVCGSSLKQMVHVKGWKCPKKGCFKLKLNSTSRLDYKERMVSAGLDKVRKQLRLIMLEGENKQVSLPEARQMAGNTEPEWWREQS